MEKISIFNELCRPWLFSLEQENVKENACGRQSQRSLQISNWFAVTMHKCNEFSLRCHYFKGKLQTTEITKKFWRKIRWVKLKGTGQNWLPQIIYHVLESPYRYGHTHCTCEVLIDKYDFWNHHGFLNHSIILRLWIRTC